MNQIVTLVVCGAFVLWCVALAFRHQSWAFAGWLPFTILCVFGTIALLSIWPQFGNSGGGAAEGFAALGVWMLFLYLLGCPLLLILSIKFRPSSYAPVVVIPTILALGISANVAVRALPHVDMVAVHLMFERSDGVPISGVTIDYETRQNVNGLSTPILSGNLQTDASGRVTVLTRVTHELRLHARSDGFARTELTISNASSTFGIHQCNLTWETQLPSDRWPQGQSEKFDIPIGKELKAIVYLPKINETHLPYPRH